MKDSSTAIFLAIPKNECIVGLVGAIRRNSQGGAKFPTGGYSPRAACACIPKSGNRFSDKMRDKYR